MTAIVKKEASTANPSASTSRKYPTPNSTQILAARACTPTHAYKLTQNGQPEPRKEGLHIT
jgi:hypothetical protein